MEVDLGPVARPRAPHPGLRRELGSPVTTRRKAGELRLLLLTDRQIGWTVRGVNTHPDMCRRRFKTGFLAGTKADRWSEGEMAEDRGPNVLWWEFEDPETEAWMEHEGDGLAESGGDLIVAAVEVDGVVVVDAPGAAQGEVEIEKGCGRGGTHAAFAALRLGLPDFERNLAEGAVDGAVLASDLHLEDLV